MGSASVMLKIVKLWLPWLGYGHRFNLVMLIKFMVVMGMRLGLQGHEDVEQSQ